MKYIEKIRENIGSFLNYETKKIVEISNWRMGLLKLLLQLIIVIYVICWVIIYDRGYQDKETVTSSVTTKVKGLLVLEYTKNITSIPRIADSADIVIPPIENNAFFVMTSQILTAEQKLGLCYAVSGTEYVSCESDRDCDSTYPISFPDGIRTGKCMNATSENKVCEILAWCPLENDTILMEHAENLFNMLKKYTVYIKNDILFPKFKVKRTNRDTWKSAKELLTCRYKPNDPVNENCPIIAFETIFNITGFTAESVVKGGVIGIYIQWDCNLDRSVRECNPKYSFHNMEDTGGLHIGFNFRYANYYRQNGTLYRDRIKVFGIRFPIFVSGTAGKFDFNNLFLNVGSGLGFLAIASVVCDFILLKLLKTRKKYKQVKFEYFKISKPSDSESPKSDEKAGVDEVAEQ